MVTKPLSKKLTSCSLTKGSCCHHWEPQAYWQCLFSFSFFGDRVSLGSPDCPGTQRSNHLCLWSMSTFKSKRNDQTSHTSNDVLVPTSKFPSQKNRKKEESSRHGSIRLWDKRVGNRVRKTRSSGAQQLRTLLLWPRTWVQFQHPTGGSQLSLTLIPGHPRLFRLQGH